MIDPDDSRPFLLGLLGDTFDGAPVYAPGAAFDPEDSERLILTILRPQLGGGPGAELAVDVYVRAGVPGADVARADELATRVFLHFHRRCWTLGPSELVRTTAQAGPVVDDVVGFLRRQVVVRAKTALEDLEG
jgi:hypothetical protein